MANGLADDVVTATCLATTAPVVVAPAMDGEMYAHPATRANVRPSWASAIAIVEPEIGVLASGAIGQGRLAELPRLIDAVIAAIGDQPGSRSRIRRSGRRSSRRRAIATSRAGTWW